MDKKKQILIVIGVFLAIAISIGVSYAYYIATTSQQGENVIRTDCFRLTYEDDGQIVLRDAYPVRDSAVNELTPYHLKIKNVCTQPALYQVNLEILNDSNLDIQYMNYKLDNGSITALSSATTETPTLNNASSAKSIATGNLLSNEEVEYDIRVWLKESVTTSDPVQNKTFKSKIVVISSLNKSIIKNITLHPNGGTVSNELFQGYVGYKYNNLPTPTKEGEDFLGWYTESTLTNKVTNNSIVVSTVTDLYAKYGTAPYTIESGDLNTVGSIVKIADEEFYVIGQEDSNHVKLLSKWNLNVGSNSKGTATGLQDEDVRGQYASGTTYGNVIYSSSAYWYDGGLKPAYGSSYPAYVYTNEKESGVYLAAIAEYVDNYVTYLTNQGVNISGRLIKQEELDALGCSNSGMGCDSTRGGTAPAWVYQTSYWTGTSFNSDAVLYVHTSGYYNRTPGTFDSNFGVRPVIILERII